MSAVAKAPSAEAAKKTRTGRKNKSDWRRKIDLGDVEQGLEEMREEERQGGVIEKRGDADLFVMDTAGDEKTKVRQRRKKELRLDEILGKRSNVPVPVLGSKLGEERKRRRDNFELRKRLKKSAGFVEGRRTTAQGIQQSKEANEFDIWGAAGGAAAPTKHKPVVSRQKLSHLTELPAVEVAHPGASYRPAAKDHKQLIEKAGGEYAAELRKDGKFEGFSSFQGLQHNDGLNECANMVLDEMARAGAESSDDDGDDGEEETVYGSADEAAVKTTKGSKRKTRADRNRERRAALRMEDDRKTKEMKEHMRQLRLAKHLNNVVKSEATELEEAAERRREELHKRATQPRKRVGKHNVPQVPEAVQLTEELAGSLRQLQPETNSFSDMYNSFVKRNIIEPNGPMRQKRKSWKIKTTEKWSYKDFK